MDLAEKKNKTRQKPEKQDASKEVEGIKVCSCFKSYVQEHRNIGA